MVTDRQEEGVISLRAGGQGPGMLQYIDDCLQCAGSLSASEKNVQKIFGSQIPDQLVVLQNLSIGNI